MFKFISSIVKEFRLLIRDRVGLALMFLMPIVLVLVMTKIQNSTFELVNDNKISIILSNNDTSNVAKDFTAALIKTGTFKVFSIKKSEENNLHELMHQHDALLALLVPDNFFSNLKNKAKANSNKALKGFGLGADSVGNIKISLDSLSIYFQPVLQESYRYSIRGALQSVLQIIENKLMIQSLYSSINGSAMPDGFEKDMMQNHTSFKEITLSNADSDKMPNASQHNVPAWTLFAMFFTVVSLGGNLVKEKLSGSFIRLKLLPTNYFFGLLAKQLVYLGVIIAQVIVIFSIGEWIFPLINLPELNLPSDWLSLIVITFVCGWCAISFALCIGVFAKTQEQSSGFGSVSVVILAAFGGVFVPAFAMPESFEFIMKLSPFYWGLESFYGLFLEGQSLNVLIMPLFPLIIISVILQVTAFIGLKRQGLI
ncbi:MAG: ABC transporter permease [Bacteroidota bacterium]